MRDTTPSRMPINLPSPLGWSQHPHFFIVKLFATSSGKEVGSLRKLRGEQTS